MVGSGVAPVGRRRPWPRLAIAVAAAGLVVSVAEAATADVVGPPPTQCTEGSKPSACHGGSYCALRPCQDAGGACAGTCQSRRLCIGTIDCTSGWSPAPAMIKTVTGSCEGGASCKQGTCEAVSVCVETDKPPAAPSATAAPVGSTSPSGSPTATVAPGLAPPAGTAAAPGSKAPADGGGCAYAASTSGRALPTGWVALALAVCLGRRRSRGLFRR